LGLQKVRIEKFRCLDVVEFIPNPGTNLIFGQNGAGKTSLLEAIFLLGRGRSFRPGQTQNLIQSGSKEFTVFGEILSQEHKYRVGLQISRGGKNIHINGEAGGQIADLVAAFPVQVIDPEVHQLIQGGPQGRRQFLDWGVFHVKQDFLAAWRRYRRALQQRNTALRQKMPATAIQAWDTELITDGQRVDADRRHYLEQFQPVFSRISSELLGAEAKCRYLPGWESSETLQSAVAASIDRDRQYGQTHVGPHRAELTLEIEGEPARHRLSRGQQKLLGISLILAQSEYVAAETRKNVALLVDEPAAELDAEHLEQLMKALEKPGIQLFLTALREDALPLKSDAGLFHVKHGALATLL
jgi:DNA replication and repair protein RecF